MSVEKAKKKAAIMAVDTHVKNNMILGIGSGSTVVYAVERLVERVQKEKLHIICIPTSFQSYQLITNNNLILGSLDNYPEIDIVIDGADEIDNNLNLIKGGGGCHVQEKIIASNSKKMIVIADFRKNSDILGEKWKKGVPVEVIPLGYIPIMAKLKKMGGNPILRMAKSKAGPCVSDNGNFIIDVDFGLIKKPKELNGQIKMIPGIVETGLFINSISADISIAYIGLEDGTVIEKIRDI